MAFLRWLFVCLIIAMFAIVPCYAQQVLCGGAGHVVDGYNYPRYIGVVNLDVIQQKSFVWKDLQKKLDQRRSYYQNQFLFLQKEVGDKADHLKKERLDTHSPLFQQKSHEISQLVSELNNLSDRRHDDLEEIYGQGVKFINNTIQSILVDVSKERGLDLILNSSSSVSVVLYASSPYDLTDEVLKRLNARLKVITIAPIKK